MTLQETPGYQIVEGWLAEQKLKPFLFQKQAWQHIVNQRSGLVVAPTGCGKTYSVFLGAIIRFINDHPTTYRLKKQNGLQLLWITPLRALAQDIARAMEAANEALGMQWKIGVRSGDTPVSERQKQRKHTPEVLIITPESLHLMLALKNHESIFQTLQLLAVDEWHELMGSKRGVLVELAVSRLLAMRKKWEKAPVGIWGISATIGNLEEAANVLLRPLMVQFPQQKVAMVKASLNKKIQIESIFPDEIERFPWAGHLGLRLVDKVIPIIEQGRSTLIFINTRGMSERWYQAILTAAPHLAGTIALHHGSIEQALRFWVEENLHSGRLKAVICTASLDLGVDFRPVETVIQVGSPKGVARFLQRAGRSGHAPGEVSKIYFLPTHSLELTEAAALKEAVHIKLIESKPPRLLCFDVLLQYITTLAISNGFYADELYIEVISTFCFEHLTYDEWEQVLAFSVNGGSALREYDDFKKLVIMDDGLYKVTSRRIAMRHRMHIGVIVSDPMMKVKFVTGGYIGVIEEGFIARLNPGDVFTLAGRNLEFVSVKEMTALVRKSRATKAIVPSWQGGRMPLSANLGFMLRKKIEEAAKMAQGSLPHPEPELSILRPLFSLQQNLSHIPSTNELLIEKIETRDGFHVFVFPFEGRLVHEAMAAVLAWRLSRIHPISFSLAMNDYGFELLSDQPIPLDETNAYDLFSTRNLSADIQQSVNSAELARRKFREIAVIGGLIFQGYPGEYKKARHLQASASLLFNVFHTYDPNNLLIRQAYHELMEQQMEEERLYNMLLHIQKSKIVIRTPDRLTPFCFPIKVDSMRETLTSEKLEDVVRRMQMALNDSV